MGLLLEALKFSGATKKINHKGLNRLGVQCARTVVARGLHQFRSPRKIDDEFSFELREQGCVQIENFLSPTDFESLRKEAFQLMENSEATSTHHHGRNTVEQFSILKESPQDYPSLYGAIQNEHLCSLIQVGERRPVNPLLGHRVVERLTQQAGTKEDSEAALHSDIFYHTHKCWLYLEDVTLDQGPLVYVPGSNKYNWVQAKHQYIEANDGNRGSRRISKKELDESGLQERVFTCKANTLVVADTTGYLSLIHI